MSELDFESLITGANLIIKTSRDDKDSIETTKDKLYSFLDEKLDYQMEEFKSMIGSYVSSHSLEISEEIVNIAPYGNYDHLIEEKEEIVKFLTEEVSKTQNWKIRGLQLSPNNLLKITFTSPSVDEGESMMGHVFINKLGKVKHHFVHNVDD